MRLPHLLPMIAALVASSASAAESKVCDQCHAEIYKSYSATPMARTSGIVDFATAPLSADKEFTDPATATHFRISRKENHTFVHFSQGSAHGERRLDYFIGAGVVGRSFASDIGGFLFEAPVSYYVSTGDWELSPGFEDSDRLALTRAVEPACLNCHASDLHSTAGTVNGYKTPAFGEAGVGCDRCHGPGETHIARMRAGSHRREPGIVNPAKLNRAERDSICAQCHLVGAVRVAKTRNPAKYEPGRRLFDSTSAFLWGGGAEHSVANTHFEQLVRSACWNGSDGKMWCGTCHDPHRAIGKEERAGFYRQKCLSCHAIQVRGCSAAPEKRRAAHDDCVMCHMPVTPIKTVAHAVQVDHTISRAPVKTPHDRGATGALVPFPGSSADDRELGLAYASEALARNHRAWGEQSFALLRRVIAGQPGDAVVELQLAQLYDGMGQEQEACNLFQQAVNDGAPGTAALVNLGTCEAKRGDLRASIGRWSEALERNPAVEAARMNLAIALSQAGDIDNARFHLRLALQFDPFSRRAQELLRSIGEK